MSRLFNRKLPNCIQIPRTLLSVEQSTRNQFRHLVHTEIQAKTTFKL